MEDNEYDARAATDVEVVAAAAASNRLSGVSSAEQSEASDAEDLIVDSREEVEPLEEKKERVEESEESAEEESEEEPEDVVRGVEDTVSISETKGIHENSDTDLEEESSEKLEREEREEDELETEEVIEPEEPEEFVVMNGYSENEEVQLIGTEFHDPVDVLNSVEEQFIRYQELLAQSSLSEFEQSDALTESVRRMVAAVEWCAKRMKDEVERAGQATKAIGAVCEQLNAKVRMEKLDNWIDKKDLNREGEIPEERAVRQQEQRAKGAEVKKILAEACQVASDSSQSLAQVQEELHLAQETVSRSKDDAVVARGRFNEAQRIAAEKKAMEEEARRLAEEKRQKQEEEERKRREEEERRQQEMDAIRGTPEEQEFLRQREEEARKERERRDPKNWPKYLYTLSEKAGEFEHGVGCVLRVMEPEFNQSDVNCRILNPLDCLPELNPQDEIVSNIILLEPGGLSENDYTMEEPWAVAIPHCAQRNPAREPAVVVRDMDAEDVVWKELPAHEVHVDLEEIDVPIKFVEARITERHCALVVITKIKTDKFSVGKKGAKISSSVDSRISVLYPPGALRVTLDMTMQVQPVDASFLAGVKDKRPDVMVNVISTSSLISLNTVKKRTFKPVCFAFPVPLNPAARGKPRPGTAALPDKSGAAGGGMPQRPKTAHPSSEREEEVDEELRILIQLKGGSWKVSKDVQLCEQKNKDVVNFELQMIEALRFIVMRVKPNASDETLAKVCMAIDESMTQRSVNLILRQSSEDENSVVITATARNRLDRSLRMLIDDGFDLEGPPPSRVLTFTERKKLEIRFRGNVKLDEPNDKDVLHMIFNSQLRNRCTFRVVEVDRFAQKAIECYRGFAQIFCTELVQRPAPPTEGAPGSRKGAPQQMVTVEEDVLLCELLINIPKPDADQLTRPVEKAPFDFRSDDSVTLEYLQELSGDIREEWKQVAKWLSLKPPRIQAIVRNNASKGQEAMALDMLITWVKTLPASTNKAQILAHSLQRTGRPELAEVLRDKERSHQRDRRAKSAGKRRR